MAVSATIDLKIATNTNPFILVVIKMLVAFGWSFEYDGAVFYLPVGDDDDFDWQRDEMSDEALLEILREKEKLGELIGVTMTWKSAGVGGEFLFRTDGSISINLSVNRKQTKEGCTDINWYVEKIIPVIESGAINVESFVYAEHV